jgi:hypothetical protein
MKQALIVCLGVRCFLVQELGVTASEIAINQTLWRRSGSLRRQNAPGRIDSDRYRIGDAFAGTWNLKNVGARKSGRCICSPHQFDAAISGVFLEAV